MKKINLILIRSTVILLFVLIGIGCQKDEMNDNISDQIFGEWEWVEAWYSGFKAFVKYPEKNQIRILEFTNDSTLIVKENGSIIFNVDIELINDTLVYFDIDEIKRINTIEIKNDTLILKNVENSYQFLYPILSIYKRIN